MGKKRKKQKPKRSVGKIYSRSIYERNIRLCRKRFPSLAEKLVSTGSDSTGIEVLISSSGLPTAKMMRPDNEWIFLHSRYDPLKESEQLLAGTDLEGANCVIVAGIGLGYLLDLLKKSMPALEMLFAMEANPKILNTLFWVRDLSFFLADEKCVLSCGDKVDDVISSWEEHFNVARVQKLAFVEHPTICKIYEPFFTTIKERLKSSVLKIVGNVVTLMEEGIGYQANTLRNIRAVAKNPGVVQLFGRLTSLPCFVIGAGPSLDKNISFLSGLHNGAVLISVDTALKPLLSANIKPHFVITADPSLDNYLHLRGVDLDNAYLVAEPMVNPASMNMFKGRIFIASLGDKMMQYLSRFLGEKGLIGGWGSVTTMAIDLAVKFGCDPVVLVGQDMAFTGGRVYCSNTHKVDVWLDAIDGGSTLGTILTDDINGRKLMDSVDLFGDTISMEQQLYSYSKWLESYFSEHRDEVEFIDATEGGILKEGVIAMPLQAAISKYCTNNVDVFSLIDKVYRSHLPSGLDKLILDMENIICAFDSMKQKCEQGIEYANRIKVITQNNSQHSIHQINIEAKKMQQLRDEICQMSIIQPFLEMAGQKALFNFHKGITQLQKRRVDVAFMRDLSELFSRFFPELISIADSLMHHFGEAVSELRMEVVAHETP